MRLARLAHACYMVQSPALINHSFDMSHSLLYRLTTSCFLCQVEFCARNYKTWLCHLSTENVVVTDPGSGSGSGASSNASLLEGGHMHQILLLIFGYSGCIMWDVYMTRSAQHLSYIIIQYGSFHPLQHVQPLQWKVSCLARDAYTLYFALH